MIKTTSVRDVPPVGKVEYSILEYEAPREFGIAVSVRATGECRVVPRISSDEAALTELFRRISDGGVTPVALYDVVYDWLCG